MRLGIGDWPQSPLVLLYIFSKKYLIINIFKLFLIFNIKDLYVKTYKMKVRFTTTVNVRTGPNISTPIWVVIHAGTVVECNGSVDGFDGRIWVSFIGNSGKLRWACAEDDDGQCYVDSDSRARI